MISKRTKAFAVLVVLCAAFVCVTEYKDFRRYQELRSAYRGQEYALQLLEELHLAPLIRTAFLIGTISLVAAFASLAIDIRHLRNRRQG
jgi:hypothetical protein